MKKFIDQWIQNPDRDMAVGIQIFEALGSETMKRRYLEFARSWERNSMAKAILLEQIKSIAQSIALQPSAFEGKELPFLVNKRGDKTDLSIVKMDDLPVKVKLGLAWNKENTPLIASIHADLSNEGITDDRRKELAEQLMTLVKTRHDNWDMIDAFLEGRTLEGLDPQEEVEDPIPMLRGVQIARRIERLKENIERSQKVVDDTKVKKLIRENALERVKAYTEELTAMEEELKTVANDSKGV